MAKKKRTPGHFGTHLRKLREARDISVQDLAARCEISRDTVYKLERTDGDAGVDIIADPKLSLLRKLAAVLDVDMNTLTDC